MKLVWDRIESWLRASAPAIARDLRPGAPAEALKSLEARLGVALPADVVASYEVHDGCAGNAPPLLGGYRLSTVSQIERDWSLQKELLRGGVFVDDGVEPEGPVRPVWWDAAWIPVATSSSGDFVCVDTRPDTGGTAGQMIVYWHADTRRTVLAPSFGDWLERFAADLESGRVRLDKDGWLEIADPHWR
jgi:molybdopterin molybdotransferase